MGILSERMAYFNHSQFFDEMPKLFYVELLTMNCLWQATGELTCKKNSDSRAYALNEGSRELNAYGGTERFTGGDAEYEDFAKKKNPDPWCLNNKDKRFTSSQCVSQRNAWNYNERFTGGDAEYEDFEGGDAEYEDFARKKKPDPWCLNNKDKKFMSSQCVSQRDAWN